MKDQRSPEPAPEPAKDQAGQPSNKQAAGYCSDPAVFNASGPNWSAGQAVGSSVPFLPSSGLLMTAESNDILLLVYGIDVPAFADEGEMQVMWKKKVKARWCWCCCCAAGVAVA